MWWWFYSWRCLRFYLGQCEADDWKFRPPLFPVPEVVACVCMLNYCFSSYDDYCPDNYNYSRFKLTVQCRSMKWELYLYGDMTIIVDRDRVEVLPRGCACLGSSPNLATDHTIYELCLPFERGMGMIMPWQFQSRVGVSAYVRVHGSSCGTCRGVLHCHFGRKHH